MGYTGYMDNLMLYYLILNQKMVVMCNYIKVYFIGISDFKVISNNKKKSALIYFIVYNFLSKFINFFELMKRHTTNMRNRIDLNAEKTQITKLTYEGGKTFILDAEKYIGDGKIRLDHVNDKLNEVAIDTKMMDYVLITCELVNSENDKICLKELIIKYKDIEEKYHHTPRNIFIFNDIAYSEDAIINLKFIKDKKMVSHVIPLKDVLNKHINYLIV